MCFESQLVRFSNYIKILESENEFYILNTSSIFESLLALFDDEYYKEQDNINKKYADFLRIKLLTDLDERFSNLKNKNKVRNILDLRTEINDELFYYLKEFFGVSIFIIKQNTKLIKKYTYDENNNCVFIINIDSKYYPIIGKKENQNIRIYNNDFIDKYDLFKNCKEFTDIKTEDNNNLTKLSLVEIQEKAKEYKINIMKLNKKGDKEIKKTKKELINEIESNN